MRCVEHKEGTVTRHDFQRGEPLGFWIVNHDTEPGRCCCVAQHGGVVIVISQDCPTVPKVVVKEIRGDGGELLVVLTLEIDEIVLFRRGRTGVEELGVDSRLPHAKGLSLWISFRCIKRQTLTHPPSEPSARNDKATPLVPVSVGLEGLNFGVLLSKQQGAYDRIGDLLERVLEVLRCIHHPIEIPALVEEDDDGVSCFGGLLIKSQDRAEEHRRRTSVGEVACVKPDADTNRSLGLVRWTRCHLILATGSKKMVQPRVRTRKAGKAAGKAPYFPRKYYAGLSKTQKAKRLREIKRFGAKDTADPSAYVGFKTDVGVKTRKSGYTKALAERFAALGITGTQTLEDKARITGVPYEILKECYDRGMAAWRTGHRPGATQQQWGYARVASFLVCGKTHYGPDADLVRKAQSSPQARTWWKGC